MVRKILSFLFLLVWIILIIFTLCSSRSCLFNPEKEVLFFFEVLIFFKPK